MPRGFEHGTRYPRSTEGEAHQRLLNGKRWGGYSKAYRERHRACALCGRPSEVVDHIEPARGDVKLFWRTTNHRALCRPCHSAKMAVDRGHRSGLPGCFPDGAPLDPWEP